MEQINNTLYALNKDGSFQEWKVFVMGDTISVEFGKLGGKIQTKRTVAKPKNIGRANETTAEQQARSEAQSKWEKQFRLGYRESTEELTSVESESPMLAHDYLKRGKAIQYPAFYQPKLDGLRCLVTFDSEGAPVFNSRGNKTYPIEGAIVDQVKELHGRTGFKYLDGEMYLHGLSLQKISSLAKKWRTHDQINAEIEKDYQGDVKRRDKAIAAGEKTYKNTDKQDVSVDVVPVPDTMRYGGYESADLEFHIFDIPSDKIWYSATEDCRYNDLNVVNENHGSKIFVVEGGIVFSEAGAKELVAQYMVEGYEGLMLRNFSGRYEFGQRSSDLQKWKEFQTIEAKVLSVTLDKNGEGVLNCVLQSGVTFSCKMKGTHAYRSYESMLNLVGHFITISFQAYTDDGAPQFPVGQMEREVNPETWEPIY